MYDIDTHTRHLAELETSVRDARQRQVQLPKPSARVISFLVVLLIAGTAIGTGVV